MVQAQYPPRIEEYVNAMFDPKLEHSFDSFLKTMELTTIFSIAHNVPKANFLFRLQDGTKYHVSSEQIKTVFDNYNAMQEQYYKAGHQLEVPILHI